MIDTKELRRLTQAATPGPWTNHGRQPNVAGLPHSAVAAKTLLARVYSEAYGDVEQETANAAFIAAANPAAVSELLDRLEAAEAEALEEARLNGMGSEREAKHLAQIAALEKERDALRTALDALRGKAIDRSVDNAFARFAGVFGKGPDAPYPGMIEAFENHYGQDFRDKDWRKEAACWAASWHRAVHRPAPASVPDGVMRERVMEAIAEALGDGAYDCTRVWSAWGYGTMGSDDFRLIANDPARLDEIAEAAIQAVFAAAPKPEVK